MAVTKCPICKSPDGRLKQLEDWGMCAECYVEVLKEALSCISKDRIHIDKLYNAVCAVKPELGQIDVMKPTKEVVDSFVTDWIDHCAHKVAKKSNHRGILVEELIQKLQKMPQKSRVIIGDNEEGVVRDIYNIKSTDFYVNLAENGLPVVEIEVEIPQD